MVKIPKYPIFTRTELLAYRALATAFAALLILAQGAHVKMPQWAEPLLLSALSQLCMTPIIVLVLRIMMLVSERQPADMDEDYAKAIWWLTGVGFAVCYLGWVR